jgi:hypothetical protein
VWGRQGGLV